MRHKITPVLWAVVMCILTVLPAASASTAVKISGVLPAYADVSNNAHVRLSPDGQYVVYPADAGSDEVFNLYSSRVDGQSQPRQLTQLHGAGHAGDYLFAASSRIVYVAGESYLGSSELHSIKIDGTDKTRLSAPPRYGEYIDNFVITSDGNTVVYQSGYRAYKVAVSGGPSTLLSRDISSVYDLLLTPDGAHLIFFGKEGGGGGPQDLFSVPLAGGAPKKINDKVLGAGIESAQLSPPGDLIIFSGWEDNGQMNLYAAPAAGGAPVLLSGPPGSGNVQHGHQVCSDGSLIVYLDKDPQSSLYSLYTVRTDGTAAKKIWETDTTGNGFRLRISPDCKSIVFFLSSYPNTPQPIYSIPIGGGEAVQLGLSCGRLSITPDSSQVVFTGKAEGSDICQFYSTPISGGPLTQINTTVLDYSYWWAVAPLDTWDDGEILFTPDGKYTFYLADHDTANTYELFQAAVDGSGVRKLNAPLTKGGNVMLETDLSSDGKTLIYRADADTDEQYELYAARVGADSGSAVYLPAISTRP